MNAAENLARWREAERVHPRSTLGIHVPEAMPALLAFAEAVLALCDTADIKPVDGLRKVHTASIRQALEQHLGGAS